MIRILGGLYCLFLWSCSGPPTEQTALVEPVVQKQLEAPASKMVHPKIEVGASADLSYALYLPDDSRNAPLILWLDPHGEGGLPVNKYKTLAERHGFAMAGSNNSQNGMESTEVLRMVGATLDDLKERLSPAPQQIYLGGFSGGARVAAMVAQNRNDISGVIGCGAAYTPRPGQRWAFYGMVGREDFNFQEFVQLESALEQIKESFWIEFFEGGHAWPESNLMNGALEFMSLKAMARGDLAVDSLRFPAWNQWKSELRLQIHDEAQFQNVSRAVAHLEGLVETQVGKVAIDNWKENPKHAAFRVAQSKMTKLEDSLKVQCQFELQTEGLDFWQKKAFTMRMTNSVRPQMNMQLRVLNYLSLVSYSLTGQYLQQNDLANAEISAQKYALVDPENPEPHVMLAKVKARQGLNPEAVRALGEAAFRDFDDPVRLRTEPDFQSLHQVPGWSETLERVQTNRETNQLKLENPLPQQPKP